jgi:hypothetical protein
MRHPQSPSIDLFVSCVVAFGDFPRILNTYFYVSLPASDPIKAAHVRFFIQFRQDAFDVLFDRAWTHFQSSPDFTVGGTSDQPCENLTLARRKQRKLVGEWER